MMMMHCKCFKCFTYDCNQCRQHLTQSLNTSGDNQQPFKLEREEGFESLNYDKRRIVRSSKPNTKDFVLPKAVKNELEHGFLAQEYSYPKEPVRNILRKVQENQKHHMMAPGECF